MAKTEVRTETKKRRWISSSIGYSMMEPHEDIRDRATGQLKGHKRLAGDCKTVESHLHLKEAKFHAGCVAIPVGLNLYEMQQRGVFETDDPVLQEILEAETARNAKSGTAEVLQEYTYEDEKKVTEGGRCKGNALVAALRED